MWCVPKLDSDYISRMEDVLDVLEKPTDPFEPVVALDERPVPLRSDVRPTQGAVPGKPARRDSEYKRQGVANGFAIVAPHEGRHFTHATVDRKKPRFAGAMQRIAAAYKQATTIHLIVDNLSTHTRKALTDTFGEREGGALWGRFTVHYTPKHGSWLNPAEVAISLWSRQCQGNDRIGTLRELKRRTTHWNRSANRARTTIQWRFRTRDARRKFGYSV